MYSAALYIFCCFLLVASLAYAQIRHDLRYPPSVGFVHLQQPINPRHPLARGLQNWWRVVPGWFGAPTWYDLSNHAPGTLQNMTTAGTSGWGATTRPGGIGEMRFDGSDDDVQITGLLGQPSTVTLSAWVFITTTGTLGSEVISLGDVVSLRVDAVGVGIECSYYLGSSTWQTTTFNTFYAGTGWHHFAYVVNPAGASQVVYVDGLQVASTAASVAIVYSGLGANTFIGRHGNGDTQYFWVGQVDDVQVWSRGLSAQEVVAVYRETQLGAPGLLTRLLPVALTPVARSGGFSIFFQGR